MGFSDVIKKSVLQGFSSGGISTSNMIFTLGICFLISAYIYFVYRWVTRSTFYDRNFNVSMSVISVIVAGIILAMQSNLIISLGMVGALSIVRFRTAIKDPMDLVFLFWSISVGIICGAGFSVIAVIASLVLTVVILAADRLPIARAPQILVINASSYEKEAEILAVVKSHCSLYKVKAINLSEDHLDMAIEVRVKEEGELVTGLMHLDHVTSASLVSHDGEVTF